MTAASLWLIGHNHKEIVPSSVPIKLVRALNLPCNNNTNARHIQLACPASQLRLAQELQVQNIAQIKFH
jgi:hypothetical protein